MSTDSAEETGAHVNIPQMEINISNTNSKNQIVLNDLLLMELLCKYPFLLVGQGEAQKDADYASWGWEQVAKAFNQNYEGIELSAPFSVSELQWRWNKLISLTGALAKTKGQIPEALSRVVTDVHTRMQAKKQPAAPRTKCQDFLLRQLPFLESLSVLERRRLEVEVLDLILQQERLEKATHTMGPKEQAAAQSEYDEFLKAIRVKELPADTLLRLAMDGFCITPQRPPTTANANKSGMVISNERGGQGVSNGSKVVAIKTEPKGEAASAAAKSPGKPRFVPLKSAKYYIKKCRIRVKRMDLDEHLPLASIRRSNRSTPKI
ncbi:uncharacterized protein LOC108022661 [Drosophila biarmipes]|uniref:uncharacterized protein LOC108022661 n=1 Tax=Drosophila biarmipes TaxID=125945 RepID=UPI0007E6E097|nr:uncharacterized protein LOC108022661 [Drosophila biarmipes]